MNYDLHISSAILNGIALFLLSSPVWNSMTNIEAIAMAGLALMVWILDEIRYPHPVFIPRDIDEGDDDGTT